MTRSLVIHVINSLKLGGAEVLLKNTVNLLKHYRHLIIYFDEEGILKSQFEEDVEFICLRHKKWSSSLRTIKKIRKIITEKNPVLVHAHLFNATLLARLATPKNVRFFFTIHNILSKDAFEVNRLSLVAEKLTYKKRHHIIAVSQEALNDYDKWVGIKGKADVLYNYINQNFFDLEYDYEQPIKDSFRLVAVGNLRRQKNYPALLQAFQLLKDIPVSLDIFGSGAMQEELQNSIDKNRLNVRLRGRVDDVSKILMNYHAYIMPSLFEGFGIAPMEAMAAGMPVLLSNLPVFKELGSDIPVYFDPADPEYIANAIKYAYLNWDEVKAEAKKGKEFIYKKASRETYFVKLQEIYQSGF